MTARQLIVPGAMPSRDRNGRASPGLLRFYSPNTTTPATVYAASDLATAHPFPIASDSAGRWPAIWADDTSTFDVAWSDAANDRLISSYAAITPADDAVLASVALAEAAAETASIRATEASSWATAAAASAAALAGAVTPTKASIGLGNVDNTADLNKPVSTPMAAAIAAGSIGAAIALVLAGGVSATALSSNDRWAINGPTFADFGAVGNGVADDTVAVNAALAWSAAQGRWINSGAGSSGQGVFKTTGRVLVASGARLECTSGGYIQPAYNESGSYGYVTQANIASKVTDVELHGLRVKCADNTTFNGNAIALYGDKLMLDRPVVDTWGGTSGRAILIGGDHVRIIAPKVINPNQTTGVGGIRVIGGTDFQCIGGYVESGDDVFQFVPAPTGALGNLDITDSWFIGCSGKSFSARLVVAALVDQNGTNGQQTMTCSIRDSGWIGVTGAGGARGGLIENKSSSGEIANIALTHTSLTGSDDTLPATLYIWSASTGGVRNVRCDNVSIRAPARGGLRIVGYVTGFYWNGGRIEASTGGSTYYTVRLENLTKAVFRDTRITANENEAVVVGPGATSAAQCYGVDFEKVTFDGIQDGQYGVNLRYASQCGIRRCTFQPANGSTTAKAAVLASTGANCTAEDNDDTALPGSTNFTLSTGVGHRMGRNLKDTRSYWALGTAAPIAEPSVTGALSSVTDANAKAVLTSILTQLAALGITTNATT